MLSSVLRSPRADCHRARVRQAAGDPGDTSGPGSAARRDGKQIRRAVQSGVRRNSGVDGSARKAASSHRFRRALPGRPVPWAPSPCAELSRFRAQ
jgi:hypothetical protein